MLSHNRHQLLTGLNPTRIRSLLLIIAVVTMLVLAGWYLVLVHIQSLERAAILAFQNTQLEIVRGAARSVELYVERALVVDGRTDIENIEQEIFRDFIAPIRLLENGDAWIYAPTYVVFDLSSDFPEAYRGKSMAEIFALQQEFGASGFEVMSDDVANAREGVGTYIWLPDKGIEVAAWTPVRVTDRVWTIGLSTPLPEILVATGERPSSIVVVTLMSIMTISAIIFIVYWYAEQMKQFRLDQELRNSEVRNYNIIRALPDALAQISTTGQYLGFIPSASVPAIAPLSKIIGRTISEVLPMDIAEAWQKAISRASAQNTVELLEYQLPIDGSITDFEARLVVSRAGEVLSIIRNVTQRKRDEQRLRQLAIENERLGILSKFIRDASHEFRTPLSIINTQLYFATQVPDVERRQMASDVIQQQVAVIDRLVSQFALVVRLEYEGLTPSNAVDVKLLLEELVARKLAVFTSHQISLTLTLLSIPMIVSGDKDLLSTAFEQLLDNALRYSRPGGKVDIRGVKQDKMWHVSISDTGIGISEEHLPRVFESFYRVDDAHSTPGFGIGLTIVQKIVALHNGWVTVQSVLGKGSAFTIELPVYDTPTVTSSPVLEQPAGLQTY
jgi:signal transduction histidine kinase